MTIFERVIPFTERTRWQMLKTAVFSDTTAQTIAKRLDWPLYRVNKMVMANDPRISLKDVAKWSFACGRVPKFEIYHDDLR